MKRAAKKPAGSAGLAARLSGIHDGLTRYGFYLSGGTLSLLLGTYIYEVFVRYFFNAPTTWSNDVSRWFLCATLMLALPEITRTGGNIAITFLTDMVPEVSRGALARIVAFIGFVVCAITAYICFGETGRQFTENIETLWTHPIPKWWVSVIIPYGFANAALHLLRQGFKPPTPGSE